MTRHKNNTAETLAGAQPTFSQTQLLPDITELMQYARTLFRSCRNPQQVQTTRDYLLRLTRQGGKQEVYSKKEVWRVTEWAWHFSQVSLQEMDGL